MNIITKINMNFVIRMYEHNSDKAFLKGAGQLHKYVGKDKAIELFNKALENPKKKPTFKMRESFKIVFHSK